MANILKGFDRMSDAHVADQIALLRSMTMWNSLSPMLAKAGRGVVRTANFFRDLVGKEKYKEPVVKELPEIIQEERLRWDVVNRVQLNQTLRQELANRAGIMLPVTDTALSVAVISEAARGLGIEEGMTPAQEAFSVTVRFQERLLRNIQQKLETQNENERKQTEKELVQQISAMSDEQREQTRKLLKVEALTGETMRAALTKASAPAAIIGLVELGGFAAYMALSRIIYAFFTVLLNITVPFAVYTSASSFLAFITGPVGWSIAIGLGWWQLAKGNQKINREMLAQAVWMGVMNLDEPIVPPDEKLPSWVPQGSRQAIEHQDAAFAQLMQERDAAVTAHQDSTRTLEQTQRALSAAQAKAQSEAERRTKAEARRRELESRIPALDEQREAAEQRLAEVQHEADAYRQRAQELPDELAAQLRASQQQHAQASSEAQRAQRELQEQQQTIATANQEISRLQAMQEEKDAQIALLEEEVARLHAAQDKAEAKAERETESRRKDLEQLWAIHFPKFIINAHPLRWTAKRRSRDEWVAIEKALTELHNTDDPMAYNRSKMKAYGNIPHMRFPLPGNVEGRLFYRLEGDGKISIIRIGTKHDDWGNDMRSLH